MKPTAQQIEAGAHALTARIPDPSAAHHEQIARQVLTPVLSGIEAAILRLHHDERCVWWQRVGTEDCDCWVADVLWIVRGDT